MANPYRDAQAAKGAAHAWGHGANGTAWRDLIGDLDFTAVGASRMSGGPTDGLPDYWSLDGVDDYLTAGDHPDFDLTSAPFSVEMWAWMGNTGHSESFSAYFSKGDAVGYQARRTTNNAAIRFDVRPQDGSSDGSTFIDTVVQGLNTDWRHIVWVHTGSTMRIIVDGQVVASASGKQPNIGVNDWPLVIGAQSDPNWRRFSRMEVAAFALYPGVALTDADARDLIAAAQLPVDDAPDPVPPVVDAGPDAQITVGESPNRAMVIIDDGGDPNITKSWGLVSAPPGHGLVTAQADPLDVVHTVPGVYVWRAQAFNSAGFGTDTFELTVVPAAVPLAVEDARSPSRASRPRLEQSSPLTVAAARSPARASRPLLTQSSPLAVRSARAPSRASRPALAQSHPLTVADARAPSRASRPLLGVAGVLVVRPARALSRASRPFLQQRSVLAALDARAEGRTDRPRLTQSSPLTVAPARAEGRADAPQLAQTHPLQVRPARSVSRASRPLLLVAGVLPVLPARAPSRASRPRLTQHTPIAVLSARAPSRASRPALHAHNLVAVRSARAPSRADLVALEHHTILLVRDARAVGRATRVVLPGAPLPPPHRMVRVPPDPRIAAVPADRRQVRVPAETRIVNA